MMVDSVGRTEMVTIKAFVGEFSRNFSSWQKSG